jgi:hypothetical protein
LYYTGHNVNIGTKNMNKQHQQISDAKKVVGLERGPLSLVSTTEELLGRKVAASV